jgi:hypothetical protein
MASEARTDVLPMGADLYVMSPPALSPDEFEITNRVSIGHYLRRRGPWMSIE